MKRVTRAEGGVTAATGSSGSIYCRANGSIGALFVAYAPDCACPLLLNEAKTPLADDDEFARYLRNRARDLLSDDYESGDAAWITGRFKNLNAQIGSYETYDDELYGVKTFFALNVLSTKREETIALRQAMRGLQAIEDSLPYDLHKKIREDIPVGVYDVVADFAQSRGGNTATSANESYSLDVMDAQFSCEPISCAIQTSS